MKKIKMYRDGINELGVYLNICETHLQNDLKIDGKVYAALLQYNLNMMRQTLQKKMIELLHKNKKAIIIRFNEGEVLTFSFFFANVPCDSYLKGIEFTLISGLTV